ncbi:MAG: hypothetical protein IJX65_04975 [Alistipes sp.]|nr:hypothetical protein [Alistipes sp.]
MRRFLVYFVAMLLLATPEVLATGRGEARNRAAVLSGGDGYYKELFMDGGIHLTSRRKLPAARALGIDMEFFASAATKELTAQDTILQSRIFCGSDQDTNGPLLYPDGAPRFRAIYVNGGSAAKHARTLTAEGRERIRQFVAAGGSYIGTCAGAFLASAASKRTGKSERNRGLYLNLWPGTMHSTGLLKSRTAMQLERGSALLRYYDFGGDGVIDSVRHNGGGYALESTLPAGTEALTRYIFKDNDKVKINNCISAWAYKKDEQSGRVVLVGSHPEAVTSGERLEYMSAMLLYAMDGNGKPKIKAELNSGQRIQMNLRTEDNLPERTAIGDRQYHHFTVTVPKGCKQMTIKLSGYDGSDNFDLALSAHPRSFAFMDSAQYTDSTSGCYKTLTITRPKPGVWYISVLCQTTVSAITGQYGTKYFGRTDVLNGVPYTISAEIDY